MGKPSASERDWKQSIRPALIISLIMGLVAGGVTTIASSGGTRNGLNVQLGGIAFLIAFIVGVLVISLLMMAVKENPADMGRGSGVHRSSQFSDEELAKIEGAVAPAAAAPAAPAESAAEAAKPAEAEQAQTVSDDASEAASPESR